MCAEEKSAHTGSKHIRRLSAIFSLEVERNLLRRNLVSQYVRVNLKTLPVIHLTTVEIYLLLARARKPELDMFAFMHPTGFRVGKPCSWRWEDVDFEQKLIHVWNAKERRWDYFPMDNEL